MTAASALDPGRRQRRASDPAANVWVAASAGSGKTKVLTDRVLRLMLDGAPPERILCLTFTKAAAAEMANRINGALGEWAINADSELQKSLSELTGATPDDAAIATARRLFARVLDVPGGLKIQTIHSFCESLLSRFPVEARVPPHAQVMDERGAAELIQVARDAVLARVRGTPDLANALAVVTEYVQEDQFSGLLDHMASERGRLRRAFSGAERTGEIFRQFGIGPDLKEADVIAEASEDRAFALADLRRAAAALAQGTEKTDQPRGRVIADWLAAEPAERCLKFKEYCGTFFTAAGAPAKSLATKSVQKAMPDAADILIREQQRLEAVLDRRRAIVTARASAALLCLGAAILDAYEAAKRRRVQLDYDDLIIKARNLLKDQGEGFAAWVLYKIDGGLDHILIDESQDTNPDQWEIVAALADEFFAGEGAREVERSVFAVGDAKQSIFSFQRADPAAFREYRDHFDRRVQAAERKWDPVELDVSFRSTEAVLRAVDAVFARSPARDGVVEPGDTLKHVAYRAGQGGLVELWPVVEPETHESPSWEPPVQRRSLLAPQRRLAMVIARQVTQWIEGDPLPSRNRPVRAGDIMILLRRRGALMEELVRALKTAGVPVAGVDRMALTEQLAVMDLIALGQFLLLPDDDLTLATVLKGPLIGLDDDALFTLAHDRGDRSLWQRLGDLSDGADEFAAAQGWLAGLLAETDFRPPYELFASVLTRAASRPGVSGWQRMIERLGPEAEDPIDEFLAQALAFERSHTPSLQGFLRWLEAGAVEIKRDLEQGDRDEVRVMTVHGAKGLQAPIVILPDATTKPRGGQGPELLWLDGAHPVWPPKRDMEESLCRQARSEANRRRDEEYRRLLYVAMTRAEDRLYVCGAAGGQKIAEDCWYGLVAAGLADVAEPAEFDFSDAGASGWAGSGLRLVNAQHAAPQKDDPTRLERMVVPSREDWMDRHAPPEPLPPRPLAPSRPSGAEPPVLSPVIQSEAAGMRRGSIIHRLLQALPDLPAEARRRACAEYLALPAQALDAAAQTEIVAEVMAILESPDFDAFFGPNSRAEVPVTGTVEGQDGPTLVSGQIDRLVVEPGRILVLDYKSARPAPRTAAETPPAYLWQMAAYRAVLQQIWQDRPVECGLLWTAAPRLVMVTEWVLDPPVSRS